MNGRFKGFVACMFAVAFLPGGCSPPDIIVQDPAGWPIADAVVTGISPSYGGQQTRTDKNGHASIPWALNPTDWIYVSKPGYDTTRHYSVHVPKPIRVVILKSLE